MARTFKGLHVVLFLFLASSAFGEEQSEAKDSHGTFTGEMKPVLYVSDVEKSAPFYRDILGFDFEGFAGPDSNPYYAEMTVAGVKFGLHEPTSAKSESKVGQLRLYFRVENLQAHRTRVLAWGRTGEDQDH